ncbi:nitroreductase family protein [Caldimonas tepidiphila]|uniref:nitroreductase family protein n=1 Tax=Caldimonas tepidiphila TaxID=2315841 RepID=UPI000E5AE649|nr:nitroreductase [Caldimonas tepidiphila]
MTAPLPPAEDAPSPAAACADEAVEALEFAGWLIHGRQHVAPKRLFAPGPDEAQLRLLMEAAAAAPDHGRLTPWRFVLVPPAARERLAGVFRAALLERDPQATEAQLHDAGDKAARAPVLLLAVADLRPAEPDISDAERYLSLGCAVQNVILAARAMGYGSGLSSGRALQSRALREAFGLAEGEHAVCFVSLGSVAHARPVRHRPEPQQLLSVFGA